MFFCAEATGGGGGMPRGGGMGQVVLERPMMGGAGNYSDRMMGPQNVQMGGAYADPQGSGQQVEYVDRRVTIAMGGPSGAGGPIRTRDRYVGMMQPATVDEGIRNLKSNHVTSDECHF